MTWTTPITPMQPGDGWCLAAFPGGLYEFLVHPDEAAWCVKQGLLLDGVRLTAEIVDTFPGVNGVLLRVWNNQERLEGFHDSAMAAAIEKPVVLAEAA